MKVEAPAMKAVLSHAKQAKTGGRSIAVNIIDPEAR